MIKKAKNTKVKSKLQESRIAKELNAKTTIASGSLYFQKADVRNDVYLVEAKTTSKDFYSLTYTTWERIEKQALKDGMRIPLMCIDVLDGAKSFAVMKHNDFMALELDKYDYYGLGEPVLTDKKSFRITSNMLDFEIPVDCNNIMLPRMDVKFVDYNKHLVILDWNDFTLINE